MADPNREVFVFLELYGRDFSFPAQADQGKVNAVNELGVGFGGKIAPRVEHLPIWARHATFTPPNKTHPGHRIPSSNTRVIGIDTRVIGIE